MESSEEEEDFLAHEWITPQSSVSAIYQSHAEKGIRRICSELLELKDAVENLSRNNQSKYLAFLRLSEEVIEVEQEIIELQKHVSAQGFLVQDLMSGVSHELDIWSNGIAQETAAEQKLQSQLNTLLKSDTQDPKAKLLDTLDVLLAEHKLDDLVAVLVSEEQKSPELMNLGEDPNAENSPYKRAILERRTMLEKMLVRNSEQPSLSMSEFKNSLSGLIKLRKGALAHQLLLNYYGSRLHRKIEDFVPSCSIYPETYAATLSRLVFSTISNATKETTLLLGDLSVHMNRIVQWAEYEIESFMCLVRENSPPSETISALRSACMCIHASLNHCSQLESQGLKFSKLLLVLLRPYVDEIIDMNFRRAKRTVLDLVGQNDILLLSPASELPQSAAETSNVVFSNSGKFMSIVKEILDQLTPLVIRNFGATVANRILHLYDRYVETLIQVLPSPSEEDNSAEQNDSIVVKAETDSQQLALMGTAYTIYDDLLTAITELLTIDSGKSLGESNENLSAGSICNVDYRDWKRHLQHSVDKLKDHFCRQYVSTYIYSREGKAKFDAGLYLEEKDGDLYWEDALPSYPFQALFARLQQLASVARDVLLGKERVQKVLLSRLTETFILWLSAEQEFWNDFEKPAKLYQYGLQQMILDMHFVVEIAVRGRYSSRSIQQHVSAIITRAIGAFSAKGIDPQSALAEDEWFVDAAKAAIDKLMLGTSGSEDSEPDEHITLNDDDISDSEETSSPLSPLSSESDESFASANNGEIESPIYLTDQEPELQ